MKEYGGPQLKRYTPFEPAKINGIDSASRSAGLMGIKPRTGSAANATKNKDGSVYSDALSTG